MIDVERNADASTGRVWDLVSDLDRWGQMLPTIRQITRVGTEDPIGVGARFEVRQPGLPKGVYEITAWEPGSGFTWVSSAPGVRTTASHEISAQDGGTRLVLGIDWSGPLAPIVRALVGSKARRMVEQEADTFVRLAEGDEQPG